MLAQFGTNIQRYSATIRFLVVPETLARKFNEIIDDRLDCKKIEGSKIS